MRRYSGQSLVVAAGGLLLVIGCLGITACSRRHYRERADREAYSLIARSTGGTPWEVPQGFTIATDPSSRLHDSSDPDDPVLPDPGPHLYGYTLPESDDPETEESVAPAEVPSGGDSGQSAPGVALSTQSIPGSYWEAIPPACLARMLEFESVRDEYRRQYQTSPPDDLRDQAPRLALDDIFELALKNSREYQAQKERLYGAALALALERFDYTTKFSAGGNGVDLDYVRAREGGETTESLGIAPGLQLERTLTTGGSLLARFANRILLTFEGPEGFSRDIGSDLLFGFTQSLLQRDIRLNALIQSERNLVYAARDFARFRKEFFVQLAAQYYGLLRNYRNIEIEAQNYFSLVRTFEQGRAEMGASVQKAPNPVAVDQYEQGMLSGRSSLISSCNRLEQGVDNLKITVGLPTEAPVNLDLAELEQLTLRDEIEVAAERVRRWRHRVLGHRERPRLDRSEILNANIFLIERVLEWLRLRRLLEPEVPEASRMEELLSRLRVDQARLVADGALQDLEKVEDPAAQSPIILVHQRHDDLIEAHLALVRWQLELAEHLGGDPQEIATARKDLDGLRGQLETLRGQLARILQDPVEASLEELLARARKLLGATRTLVATLDRMVGGDVEKATDKEVLEKTLAQTDRLLEMSAELLVAAQPGLAPIDIEVDDAMATALIHRLDLMNERGSLADDWRAIKLAADDLKSVLNLSASYSVGTRDNKPFKFSRENSRAQVGLTFDLPLNRVAQRNSYRQALIDYQAGRRSVTALEDGIKRDIRDELRNLAETRIQYPISVTQAALAAEQVTSIRLQLALGVPGVRATDLLDALRASRQALIAVANARIGYIVDRARFVLDLELMELDEGGTWPAINDPAYQPRPDFNYPAGAGPTYGTIPSFLQVSRALRRMLDHPLPGHDLTAPDEDAGQEWPPSAEGQDSSG